MRAERFHRGYTDLRGIVNSLFLSELIRKAAGMKGGFCRMEMRALLEFIFSRFPGEVSLEK